MTNASDLKTDRPRRYHHGNLVGALITATVEIIEERGVEHVSVREAAKRAGVSPGAPFRHFQSKTALLTAVAEQAMDRLTATIADTRSTDDGADPIEAFEAIGRAYLDWALANPTHFEIISSRTLIDFHGSERLRGQNQAIRGTMIDLLAQAQRQGRLALNTNVSEIALAARAFVYGLSRMAIDGHFPEWHPDEAPAVAAQAALHLFIGQMFKPAEPISN